MSERDFRCLVSGVSLLEAEAAAWLFVRDGEGQPQPVALPIWGGYFGRGKLEEPSEGPNTQLLESAFAQGVAAGTVSVAWSSLGLEPGALDDAEGILSLALLASIHGESRCFSWHGRPVHCALIEANVAAALMQGEPERLQTVPVEDLGHLVLPHPISRDLYDPVARASAKDRCKFGLGFVSCASLIDALHHLDVSLTGPGSGIDRKDREPNAWLAEALERFSDDEELLLALSDYATRDS